MREIIDQIIGRNPEVYRFRYGVDKEKLYKEIMKKYDSIGDSIRSKANGRHVHSQEMEKIVYEICRPHLTGVVGKFIPKHLDVRTTENKKKNFEEMSSVLDFFLEKSGLVFIGEHLGDYSNRESMKNFLAQTFLHEGTGTDSRIRFRMIKGGMLSTASFDPMHAIMAYSKDIRDNDRTTAKQKEMREQLENEILTRRGLRRTDLSSLQLKQFVEEIDEKIKPIAYSKRRLPQHDPAEVQEQFAQVARFKLQLANDSAATLQQRTYISEFAKDRFEWLNTLPEPTFETKKDFSEPWGSNVFENTKGVAIALDNPMFADQA